LSDSFEDGFEDGFATISERYIAPPVYTSAINVPDHQGTDQPTELPLIFVKALISPSGQRLGTTWL